MINLVAVQENKKYNPSLDTPIELLGSTYGATRDGLLLNKQCASDIAVVVMVGCFCIIVHFIERIIVTVSH